MAEVGEQPVRDVDHRCGARHRGRGPRRVRRLGHPVRRHHCGRRPETALQHREPRGGPADAARERDDVARPCPGPGDRRTPLERPERGDRERERGRHHHVAADQARPDAHRFRPQPVGQPGERLDRRVGRGRQPDEQRGRHRAHRGDVGQVGRRGLAPNLLGSGPVQPEMHALDEHVGRRHDATVRRGHDGGVVTGPEDGARGLGAVAGDLRDEPELAERRDRGSIIRQRVLLGYVRPPTISRPSSAERGTPWCRPTSWCRPRSARPPPWPPRSPASSGVISAEDVTGPYDVIVRAEAEDVDRLGQLVVARVQGVGGITRTLTCPVVHLG